VRFNLKLIPIACLLLLAVSCEKDPGEGGNSTLEGKVVVHEVSPSGNILAQYDGAEERVYIIYGDNEIYDDEVRSSYDGRFKLFTLTVTAAQAAQKRLCRP